MKIKKMPNKKTLEDFLNGTHGNPKVYFDKIKGVFRYHDRFKRDNTSQK